MSTVKLYRPVMYWQKTCQSLHCSVGVFRCVAPRKMYSSEVRTSRDHDLIGPPHSVSNLRRVVFAKKPNETRNQQYLRLQKEASYKWQQEYWTEHNNSFNKSKKKFLETRKTVENENDKQYADDLSVFYKDFLDKNYTSHKTFLWQWYKRNFNLLWPSFVVLLEKFTKSINQRN